MKFGVCALAGLKALLAASAASSAELRCASPDFNHEADEIIATYVDSAALSGAVLLEKDGRLLVRRAFGSADRSWQIPNSLQTRFRIASLGKQFVAAAILQLVDQGKIALDDPVSKHLPDAPASWTKVTVNELLNHTSGIPDYTDTPGFLGGLYSPPRSFAEILKLVRDKPLAFEPGTSYRYDNTGYAVLIRIIETVSGQSYGDYLADHLFRPLGMNDTGVDEFGRIVPGLATGYSLGSHGWEEAQDLRGLGDPYSTVGDMLRWRQGLFGGRVLSPGSLKLMTTDWGHGYGFGLRIARRDGHELILHAGGEPGFRSALYWYPSDGITSIGLSNFDGIELFDLAADLAKACLGLPVRPAEVKLSPAALDRYVGRYRLSPDETLTITREGDHLVSRSEGDIPTPIFAKNDHEFFARIRRVGYAFEVDAAGRVTDLVLSGSAGGVMGSYPRLSAGP
jgi:D-alanyl-D-alanine carboxypeptidase